LSRSPLSISDKGAQELERLRGPLPPRPDFAGWAQAVDEHAARTLAAYPVGSEARKELEPVLEGFASTLKTCDMFARRIPGLLMTQAGATLSLFEEMIPYLHNYGIEDTDLLDEIKGKLSKWLEEEERQRGPTPPI
jgi:hypothetical protein